VPVAIEVKGDVMNMAAAEVIILTTNALGCGILLFVAVVVQPIMDNMDELAFKQFLNALDRTAMTDHVVVTVATLPLFSTS
jgi:hypothetical protein